MAIYHFSVKTISRGNGRSAVACAAYRSGEKLVCNFYGKEQDYTKKTGVEFTEIYAPDNTNTELLNRQILWNEVEKVERRKDALLAREFEIAFPSELNAEQRKNMLNELCQDLVKKYGVIVDAAIHAPHTGNGSDERNYHAHIMFTTRSINEDGEFSAKKYRDFSRDNGTETVSHWRESFAKLCNHHLEQNGFDERVDHRSYEDQKSELEATQHEGPAVTFLRRQYEREQEKPEKERNKKIVMPKIALKNNEIKALNNEKIQSDQIIKGLDQEILLSENVLDNLKDQYSKTDAGILHEYNDLVDRLSKHLKKREYEALEKKNNDLVDQILAVKAKEPRFFGRQKWVNEHNDLVTQYQENLAHIELNKKSDPADFVEKAKEAIQKSKPDFAKRVKEVLFNIQVENSYKNQLEREALQRKLDQQEEERRRKIHEKNEQIRQLHLAEVEFSRRKQPKNENNGFDSKNDFDN